MILLERSRIWGPDGEAYMIRSFLEMVAAGAWVMKVGEPSARIDNTHVHNLVRGALLAAVALGERPNEVGGKPYFITDGEAFSAMEWFAPLAESIGVAVPRLRLPSLVLRPLAHLMELGRFVTGGDPTLTRIKATKLCVPNWASIDAARSDLGYEPTRQREHLRIAASTIVMPSRPCGDADRPAYFGVPTRSRIECSQAATASSVRTASSGAPAASSS